MHWIYVLQCENGIYYVGETSRLYSRFWEHFSGYGGVNTSSFTPINIVAIYKVETILKFLEYHRGVIEGLIILENNHPDILKYNSFHFKDCFESDYEVIKEEALIAENTITERLMIEHKQDYHKIRGGRNIHFDKNGYAKCIYSQCPVNPFLEKIPVCFCGVPCDIKVIIDNKHVYFRCPKKNIWSDFREEFDIDEPCNYYQKYNYEDKILEMKQQKIKELVRNSYRWLKNVEIYKEDGRDFECVSCLSTGYKNLLQEGQKLRLCWNCFLTRNKELENKYKYSEECMITP